MDEKKEEKKKESIDEILSDLNSLLNKMPAILGDIELPSAKPAEPGPAPVQEDPRAQDGAPSPESSRPGPAEPAPVQEDAFERTVKLDPEHIPVSGGSVDRMVIQSLDEFTITPESLGMQDGQPALSEPLALPGE
ncbi:MAG TPA: hypothetical protein PL037_09415, partial [Elusimicrobiales bacterium]|nr:hypothetical protein [Elusimicrobiales bacterium]